MSRRTAFVVWALLSIVVSGSVASAAERELSDKEIKDLYCNLKEAGEGIRSVQAKFVKKVGDMWVREPIVSKGLLIFDGDEDESGTKWVRVRMEVTEPKDLRMTLAINGRRIRLLQPRTEDRRPKGEEWVISDKDRKKSDNALAELMTGMNADLQALRERFEVSVVEEKPKQPIESIIKRDLRKHEAKETEGHNDATAGEVTEEGPDKEPGNGCGETATEEKPPEPLHLYRIELLPKEDQEKLLQKVEEIQVWTDGVSPWPRRLFYISPDGTSTEYIFSEVVVNEEVDDKVFNLEWPGGTEIKRHTND
jgi:outer membrane lipoprotein-sorting protein